jgi:uncharacterized protein
MERGGDMGAGRINTIARLMAGLKTGLAAALVATMFALAAPAGAQEQAQERPKSLLERLFNRSNRPPAAVPEAPAKKQSKPRKRTQAAAPPPAPAPEKLVNARKILVIGDFMASGTAGGLGDAFRQMPGVTVIDAANGSSGLVRDDFYNWPVEINGLLDTHQPSVVVVMIGANDRQKLQVNGVSEQALSPAWTAAYRQRATALAETVAARKVPLLWIGQVPFRSAAMTADMLALNELFREIGTNERTGASFVDVWEGFVDENGKFIERGPDVNGRIVALRSGPINITKAGYRKIAFFVERGLRRVIDEAALVSVDPNAPALGLPGLPSLQATDEASLQRLRPVNLLVPAGATDALLGEVVAPVVPTVTRTGKLPPAGRIDDFSAPSLPVPSPKP